MSPKTRATRHFAAASCSRIDFVASRLAAAAWLLWLACAALVTLTAEIAWSLRLAGTVWVLAAGTRAVWRFVLLRGPGAVRALEWRDSGGTPAEFHVWLGEPPRRLPAVPEHCLRYGDFLWLLRFRTPGGIRELLLNPACQEPAALRRLSRRLDWESDAAVRAS